MEVTVKLPELDVEGYLTNPDNWSEAVAEEFAREENIGLTEDHWDVIRFMRNYYETHQIIPDVRHVIWHLEARLGKGTRNKVFELFPYGYVKQACRIAGMRRPRAWSTG